MYLCELTLSNLAPRGHVFRFQGERAVQDAEDRDVGGLNDDANFLVRLHNCVQVCVCACVCACACVCVCVLSVCLLVSVLVSVLACGVLCAKSLVNETSDALVEETSQVFLCTQCFAPHGQQQR